MMTWLGHIFQADFLQGMMAATLFFLMPLKKRPCWGLRFGLLAVLSLLAETPLVMLVDAGWNQPIAYLLPVLFPLGAFLLCSASDLWQSLYGMACVYAAQHIAFCAVVILWGNHEETIWVEMGRWGIHLLLFALLWWFVARRLPMEGQYRVSIEKTLLTLGLVLFIALFLSFNSRDPALSVANTSIYRIYMTSELLSCLFLLLIQKEQRREAALLADVETERRLRQQMQMQYQLSRENIDIINRKSHDLKHQIAALRLVHDPDQRESSLREMEEAVQIYDTTAQTGNEVLDTVLREKGLLCRENGILFTHMADGRGLEGISAVDLYTLLGNALDNAIESTRTIREQERRVIRVAVRQGHGVAFLQIENYYDHPLQLEQGLPQTTKEDRSNHGFGLKSIQRITERYEGSMDIELNDGRFLLTVVLPVNS